MRVGCMDNNYNNDSNKMCRCNSMKELRAAAATYGEDFTQAFDESIKPTKELLIQLFKRLRWKDQLVEELNLQCQIFIAFPANRTMS